MSFQNTQCLMSVFHLHPGLFSFLFILSLPFSFLLPHPPLSFSVLLLSSQLLPYPTVHPVSSFFIQSRSYAFKFTPILTCSFILSTCTAFNFHFFLCILYTYKKCVFIFCIVLGEAHICRDAHVEVRGQRVGSFQF